MEPELGPEMDGDEAMFTKDAFGPRSFHRHCLAHDSSESNIPAPENESDAQRGRVSCWRPQTQLPTERGPTSLAFNQSPCYLSLLEKTKTTEFQLLPQMANSFGLLLDLGICF